jgi:ABC-type transport system substrate-binding protein
VTREPNRCPIAVPARLRRLSSSGRLLVLLTLVAAACRPDAPPTASTSRVLRISVASGLHGFGLARTRQFYEANFATLVYEGLTAINSAGQPVPALATRWSSSPDSRVWRFTLRPHVRFHDGSQFGPADVIRSWEQMLRSRIDDTHDAWMLNSIEGAPAVGEGNTAPLHGMRIVDDSTIEVRLTRASPRFATDISSAQAFISAAAATDSLPIGTGPWRWIRGAANAPVITLAKNALHWRHVPRMDSLVVRVVADSLLPEAFRRGDVDCTADFSRASRVALSARSDVRFVASGAPGLARIIFDMKRFPVFRDVRVRQAFVMALDRPRIARDAAAGPVTVASGPLPPSIPGADSALSGWPYDPDRARALLTQAGFDFSQTLPVAFPGPQTPELGPNFARLLIAYWEAIGIKVSTLAQDVNPPSALDLHISYPEVGDPDAYLYSRFHSSVAGRAGNSGAFADAEVDRLLDVGRSSTDSAARRHAMHDAAARIDQLAANIFLWYNPVLTASSTRITPCVAGGPTSDFSSVALASPSAAR